jgi:hypothetical protein
MVAVQIAAVATLLTFYGWVAYLVATPNVTQEFRNYYILRNTSDWRPVRYPARLEEGFDFSRPGYPDFVSVTAGISSHEDWGRWTDARLYHAARVVFKHKFSGPTCVELKARPASKQIGKEATIRFGEQGFQFLTLDDSPTWFRFDFFLEQPANALEVAASVSASPSEWGAPNKDVRKLGLGLYRLLVVPGKCQHEADNVTRAQSFFGSPAWPV